MIINPTRAEARLVLAMIAAAIVAICTGYLIVSILSNTASKESHHENRHMNAPTPPRKERNAHKLAMHITLGKFLVLRATRTGPRTMTDLAKIAHITTAGMTCMRDSLKQDGLIEDKRQDNDRRVVLVSLTPRGQEVVTVFESQCWGVAAK